METKFSLIGTVLIGALLLGCWWRGTDARIEIGPDVTSSTMVNNGTIRISGDGMTVELAVPDNSPVLQFKNPTVDIDYVCDESSHEAKRVKCSLSVTEGKRIFSFMHELTPSQQDTFKKVLIKRLYEDK